MKIRHIRELSFSSRIAARERLILSRPSVVGELTTLRITMNNPLQFPIFVDDKRAVVTIDGWLHFQRSVGPNIDSGINSDCTENSSINTGSASRKPLNLISDLH